MKKFKLELKKNLDVELEINDWAQRANISLVTRCLDSVVLTTLVIGEKKENIDFVPLTIDYDEKYYAAGKIYGSKFLRREGKASETAILNARLIDRGLRPSLKNIFNEIQIVNTIISLDPDFDPDLLAFLGSSLALEMMFDKKIGPVVPVKVCQLDNNYIFFPRESEKNFSNFCLFASGIKNKINMIEFEGQEIQEDEIIRVCDLIIKEINILSQKVSQLLIEIKKELNFQPLKADVNSFNYFSIGQEFLEKNNINIDKLLFNNQEGENLNNLFNLLEELKKENPDYFSKAYLGVIENIKKVFQYKVLKDKLRPDGRKLDEIRKIDLLVNLLPRVHGSALFKRGLTHIMSAVTLGSLSEELWVREIEFEGYKRFIHHYNFPPFSTGEIGSLRGPSRREIGHGNLVEKALKNLIPDEYTFPYTIRIVSDVLSSNGSTSMGSVCSSTLALLDAGVPIKNKCAGISIGIVYEDDNNYELLTDIQGPEDFWGGMDFKVAGTNKGVTAIQLDVKIEGLTLSMIKEALERAKTARLFILKKIDKVISSPRKELKEIIPRSMIINIDPNKIGLLIGPGGRVINEIITLTNAKIDIKQDGTLYLSAPSQEALQKTINFIKLAIGDLNQGEIFEGKIIKILDFGFIIDLGFNKTALLHISEVPKNNLNDFNLNKNLKIKIKQINDQGRIYVSLDNDQQ
jgi:polyribonucleotide nucleotidyltransferase